MPIKEDLPDFLSLDTRTAPRLGRFSSSHDARKREPGTRSSPASAAPLGRPDYEEVEPDGGLTYSEQAMLRNFGVKGYFQPAVLHAIVDRLERVQADLEKANRESMWCSRGSFEMAEYLRRRLRFRLQVWRVRTAMRLYDAGFTRFRASILAGIYATNREYYATDRPI